MAHKWKDIQHKKDLPRSGEGKYYNIEEYERMEKEFNINLKTGELNTIFGALGKMPFDSVALLVQNMTKQIGEQKEADENDTEEE